MIQNRQDLLDLVRELGLTGLGCELGVGDGYYSYWILRKTQLKKLYSVDPWDKPEGSQITFRAEPELYMKALKNLMEYGDRSYVLRMLSVPAAELFPDQSMSFVYIDANHAEAEVEADIAAWWPKIKRGGILAGHDYGTFHTGVTVAVDRFVKQYGLKLHLTANDQVFQGHIIQSWFVAKDRELNL